MYIKINNEDLAQVAETLEKTNTVFVVGPPCSGKNTLLKALDIESFSTGDYYRKKAEVNAETKDIINSGNLMPDDETTSIVIRETSAVLGVRYIDGYPRTIEQAKKSLDIFGKEIVVIYLNASRETCELRSLIRQICKDCGKSHKVKDLEADNRCDKCRGKLVRRDDEAEMPRRLDTFFGTTIKVLPFFHEQGVLIIEINANFDIEDVFVDVCKVLDSLLKRKE